MKQQKRYDFWGNKIKTKTSLEKKSELKKDETKKSSREFRLLLLSISGIMVALIIASILAVTIYPSVTNDTYIIKIFNSDCETGELIFEKTDVSATFLLENGLGERISFFDTKLIPTTNPKAWNDFLKKEYNYVITIETICINFVKE